MFPKNKRIENRELLNSYYGMRCLACRFRGCDPHHLISRGAGGPDEVWNILPVCRIHHAEIHVVGLEKMAAKHILIFNFLKSHGWKFDNYEWVRPQALR